MVFCTTKNLKTLEKKIIYYDPNKAKFELTQLEPNTIATHRIYDI